MNTIAFIFLVGAGLVVAGTFFRRLGKRHFDKRHGSGMSKHGIVMPPPKIGLPLYLDDPEKLRDHLDEGPRLFFEVVRIIGNHYVHPDKWDAERHTFKFIEAPITEEEFNDRAMMRTAEQKWDSHGWKSKKAAMDLNRYWRIERSRADHLEEMVDRLQQEVNDLKGNNGWLRSLFPRRH